MTMTKEQKQTANKSAKLAQSFFKKADELECGNKECLIAVNIIVEMAKNKAWQ